MKKILTTIQKYLPNRRKIMQLYFALLFNANLRGYITGTIYNKPSGTKFLCAPGINCYSCPGAIAACPLGSLQGSYDNGAPTILYVSGILLLYAIFFGRMICGWLCPFGLIQELLYLIKSPKMKKSPVTRILSYLKYVILVFFAIIVPATYALRNAPTPGFCKYICPAGTIEGGLLLLSNKINDSFFSMLGPLFTWKFMLMISIVVGSVFIFRLFCRFICPLGGLYGLFNKISVFGVKVDEEKCTHCNICVAHCKCDIHHVGDQECISCGECIDVCPTKAISWKGSKIFLKCNEIPADADDAAKEAAQTKQKKLKFFTRAIGAVVMAAVLIGAIAYYWNVTAPAPSTNPTTPTGPSEPAAVLGSDPGNKLASGNLPIITVDGITQQTIDPTATGKITVINFWGTWCGPCVAELPYFDQIASHYGDSVTVIAIHTDLLSEDAPEFIQTTFPNSSIIFAKDDENSTYYNALGGRGNYPHTVIIDENGIVLAKFVEALEYEDLEAVIEAAQNKVVAPLGSDPGNKLASGNLPIITVDGITQQTIDPTATGKITVINFWGTWCGPCVAELPYFDQIASHYGDSVTVIAIHTDLLSEDAPEFIQTTFPNSSIIFAKDDENSTYYNALGGRGNYPHTVIIDENGIVLAKFVEALEYEDLEAVIEKALND